MEVVADCPPVQLRAPETNRQDEDHHIGAAMAGVHADTMASRGSDFEDDEDEEEDDEPQAPDGGWGWVVVAASFLTNVIADGSTFTFGIIYVELLDYFQEQKGKTAWIGGLYMAMPLLAGPVASYLTDRWGCRCVCITGALLAALGFIISSFAESIELLIFTFGIVSGFGLALCYVAAVVIVAYYFDKRRSLATGLAVCGSGIGTFLFAPLTDYLIAEYGWRGATLILAGFFLNIIVFASLMRDLEWTKARCKALREEKKRKNREKRASKTRSQSIRTATSSTSSSQQLPTQPSAEELKRLLQSGESAGYALTSSSRMTENDDGDDTSRQCNSVLNLPTYVHNVEKVPPEVLAQLSTNQSLYPVLVQNYPNVFGSPQQPKNDYPVPCLDIISPEKQLQLKNRARIMNSLSPDNMQPSSPVNVCSPLTNGDKNEGLLGLKNVPEEDAFYKWLKKIQLNHSHVHHSDDKLSAVQIKDLRLHRHSLTYCGAMLNMRRHRLRAASCPDICHRPVATVALNEGKTESRWYSCLLDLWDVVVDMVDISHFSDTRFFLFAISNFLLYSWYHVPYVFLTHKAIEMGFDEHDASYLISYLGIFNMVGEIILGWAGDQPWVNAGMVYAVSMGVCGLVTAIVPFVTTYAGLAFVAGCFGASIAANYALVSIILVDIISLDRFTNAFGLLLLVQGLANLVGPPLAGWLYDVSGNHDLSFFMAGLFIAACGILLVILPAVKWMQKRRACKSGLYLKAAVSPSEQSNTVCAQDSNPDPRTLLPPLSDGGNPV